MAILQQVVEFEPELLITRIYLARAALSIGDDAAAVNAIRPEAVDHLPGVSFHYCRIAGIYIRLEDFAAAERYLVLAKEAFPESPPVWWKFGELNGLRGQVDEAVSCFQRVVPLESTRKLQIGAIQHAAVALANAGRKDAEYLYQQILELDKKNPFAHFGIVDCRRELDPADPILNAIQQLVTDRSVAAAQKSHLHYALGNVYHGSGNASAAFAHWMIANRIRSLNSPKANMAKRRHAADARCKFFTAETIEELSQHGCQEDGLVCVVGMPRSGTTLTEQILGSHSGARPLGERNDFWRLTRNLPKLLRTKTKYPECCGKLTPKRIGQIWRTILDRMHRAAGPCMRMVTKLPEDYFELGMIKILFPKVRIIHTRRNPLDVGLSCFMQNFRNIPYSRNMESLAEAFRLYRLMMQHWRSVLPPSSIFEVTYEHLVMDPENIVRQMCDFVGLPFEPTCLEFHRQNRTVKTCSRWQVRQPIYQTSVNRSDAYREFLGPLLEFEDEPPSIPVEVQGEAVDVGGQRAYGVLGVDV